MSDNNPALAIEKMRHVVYGVLSRFEAFAGQAPLRFSFVASLLLMVATILALRISYEVNDDVQMTMIVSGRGLSAAPDEHLVFTNVIIGTTLKHLYVALPLVPWYGCYLLTVHLLSQTGFLYCALTIGRRSATSLEAPTESLREFALRCGLYLLYFVLVEVPLLNQLQFTTTAFIAAQAGIFLWLLAWQRRTDQSDAGVAGPLCAATLLIFLGSLVRWESLAMALIVALPAGLFVTRHFSLSAVIPCGLAMAIAAALVSAAFTYDRWVYEQDPNWNGFRDFNQVRRIFNDLRWTSFTPETAAVFSQVGWSENDHAMIARWYYDDPQIYSEANLQQIALAQPWNSSRLTPQMWWEASRTIVRHRAVLSILIALPFILAVVSGRARAAILASIPISVAILVLVIALQKVPAERIYFPLLSLPLSVALLSFAWPKKPLSVNATFTTSRNGSHLNWHSLIWPPTRQRVVVMLLVVAVVMGLWHQFRRSVKAEQGHVAWQEFFNEQRDADNKLYVCFESSIPYEGFSPFDNLASWSNTRLLSLLWTQRTPFHEGIKRDFGITNLAQALYERDDLLLIAKPEHLPLFATFAKEHFGADVEFVESHEASRFIVGKFRQRATAENTVENVNGGQSRDIAQPRSTTQILEQSRRSQPSS